MIPFSDELPVNTVTELKMMEYCPSSKALVKKRFNINTEIKKTFLFLCLKMNALIPLTLTKFSRKVEATLA